MPKSSFAIFSIMQKFFFLFFLWRRIFVGKGLAFDAHQVFEERSVSDAHQVFDERSVKETNPKMAHLERALQWLRPILVGSQMWDYCVVWKVVYTAHDMRSIEWMNCCCVGGSDGESCRRQERKSSLLVSTEFCRDSANPHLAIKKSCIALAKFPFLMPLQSFDEIYGQVMVSSQPKWINLPDKLSPNSFHETVGTRVLIPVLGGLVELFAAKQIYENQAIMDFVAALFNNGSQKIDTVHSLNYKDVSFKEEKELCLGECINSWVDFVQQSEFKPSMIDLLSGQLSNSPCASIPSCLGPTSLSENSSPKHHYQSERDAGCNDLDTTTTKISHVFHGKEQIEERDKEGNEKQFKSKNLYAERKRRARIQHALCNLRSLVPNITKMNQTATLDDAIDHIVEMQKKVKDLQNEIEELERDDVNGTKSKPSGTKGAVEIDKKNPGPNYYKIHQVEVEVNKLAVRKFLIKILCKANAGAFTRLLEALSYMGLLVTEVNVTSCKGIASNSFVVQAINGDIQAGELRKLLMHTCG